MPIILLKQHILGKGSLEVLIKHARSKRPDPKNQGQTKNKDPTIKNNAKLMCTCKFSITIAKDTNSFKLDLLKKISLVKIVKHHQI